MTGRATEAVRSRARALPAFAARRQAAVLRRAAGSRLESIARRPLPVPRALDAHVVSLSCARDLPETVVALRSFLRHVGRPASYTVVSDGSLLPAARALLAGIDRCVEVVDWTAMLRPGLPPPVRAYAATSAMGKKLALELSLPVQRPTVYADTDVLFFPAAGELASGGEDGAARAASPAPSRFLLDCEDVYLDRRLLAGEHEAREPVNAGLLLLTAVPEWEAGLERLARLDGDWSFHTEQTVVHLALHAAGARPLDPRRYVVAIDDMREYGDRHAGPDVAARHYTTPTRRKLWQRVGLRPQ